MSSHPPILAGADESLENKKTPRVNEAVHFLIDKSKGYSQSNLVLNAEVTVSRERQKSVFSLKTNGEGNYTTPSLPIGSYSISMTSRGFQPERRQGIDVQVDAHLRVNFSLKPVSVNETVNVTTEGNQVNTSSSELGTVISSRPIQELPVSGRSVLALTQLTPGVSSKC